MYPLLLQPVERPLNCPFTDLQRFRHISDRGEHPPLLSVFQVRFSRQPLPKPPRHYHRGSDRSRSHRASGARICRSSWALVSVPVVHAAYGSTGATCPVAPHKFANSPDALQRISSNCYRRETNLSSRIRFHEARRSAIQPRLHFPQDSHIGCRSICSPRDGRFSEPFFPALQRRHQLCSRWWPVNFLHVTHGSLLKLLLEKTRLIQAARTYCKKALQSIRQSEIVKFSHYYFK